MQLEQNFSNIIIMAPDLFIEEPLIDCSTDFSVSSSFGLIQTLGYLKNTTNFFNMVKTPFPLCVSERILIHITLTGTPLARISIQSPVNLKSTVHILERICTLLENSPNEISFFCPDE